jgi:hypothetical protein
MVLVFGIALAPRSAHAQSKCEAGKLKATAKLSSSKLNALSKYALNPDDSQLAQSLVKASATARKQFEKFDIAGGCIIANDFLVVQEEVDSTVRNSGKHRGTIPPTNGCMCTVSCFATGGTVGSGTGFADDPVQCASLAEKFCKEQTVPKYPNGIAVGKSTKCTPFVAGSGCQCNAACSGAGTPVTDVTVEDVTECVDLAETGCGDLDSVQTFDCEPNP